MTTCTVRSSARGTAFAAEGATSVRHDVLHSAALQHNPEQAESGLEALGFWEAASEALRTRHARAVGLGQRVLCRWACKPRSMIWTALNRQYVVS